MDLQTTLRGRRPRASRCLTDGQPTSSLLTAPSPLHRAFFWSSAVVVLLGVVPLGCGVGGGGLLWGASDQPYDDEVVPLKVSGRAFTVANQSVLSTRPTATGLLFAQLDDVLAQQGSTAGEAGAEGEDRMTDPIFDEAVDSCPLGTEWELGATVSCRGLSSLAVGFAFEAAGTLQQELDADLVARHGGELQSDELMFVSAWNREAIQSGIRSGAVQGTALLRELGVCDQRMMAEERVPVRRAAGEADAGRR